MKCHTCGKTGFHDLKGVNAHKDKEHPGWRSKAKKKAKASRQSPSAGSSEKSSSAGIRINYCPRCGERLGG